MATFDLSSPLAKRILTAAILIPLVVAAVLYLPSQVIALLFGLIVLLGADEWARLSGIDRPTYRILYVLVIAGVLAGIEWLATLPGAQWVLLGLVVAGWGMVTIRLLTLSEVASAGMGIGKGRLLLGLFVLPPAWGALVALHRSDPHGPGLVMFLLVLIWVADSAAYFAGRRWGRTKLAPQISPGKTREGAYGALVGALLCGVALHLLGLVSAPLWYLLLLALAVVVISIVGDLFESLIKRIAGMKDSGTLLPGHGGVLDRIDSLTSAAPLFMLGLLFGAGL